MISEGVALEQIAKISETFRLPEAERAQNALIEAFREASLDEAHADAIGDFLVRTSRFCPVPADVQLAGLQTYPDESPAILPEWNPDPLASACRACGGTGLVPVYEIRRRITKAAEIRVVDSELTETVEVFERMEIERISAVQARAIQRKKRILAANEELIESVVRCRTCALQANGSAA